MRNLSQIILIHFSAALANPSPTQKPNLQEVIRSSGRSDTPCKNAHQNSSIKLFCILKQYSTEASQLAHKYIVKDAYNRSNKQVDIADQLMVASERMNAFHIRELNLKRFAADSHYDYNNKMIRLLRLHSSDQTQHVNRNMKLHGQDRTLDLTVTHYPKFGLSDYIPRRVLSNFEDAESAVHAEISQIAPWIILSLLEPFYRRIYGIDMARLDHVELRRYVFRLAYQLRVTFPLHQDSDHGLG
ncbi:hypothetical protein EDC01DRAFT_631153 [Geopyxis carbonaria]|nr:hypothetical protein EDC01DRAFT_631153 [Geopyxis carbonaria]